MNKFRTLGVPKFTLGCSAMRLVTYSMTLGTVLMQLDWKMMLPGYSVCHLLATWIITRANGKDYPHQPKRVPKFRVQQYSKPARVVLLMFPGSSRFQSVQLQDCITLHLHENWMQFLKQLPAVNCFWSPYKECYQDVTRWVSVLFSGTVQWCKILQKPTKCTIILH